MGKYTQIKKKENFGLSTYCQTEIKKMENFGLSAYCQTEIKKKWKISV